MRRAAIALVLSLSASSLSAQQVYPHFSETTFEKSLANDLAWLPVILKSRDVPDIPQRVTAADLEDLKAPGKAVNEMQKAEKELKKDRIESAIAHLQKAVKIYPQYSKAYVNMAVLYLRLNKTAEAETSFRKAVEANGANVAAKQSLGYFCLAVNRPNDALPTLRAALSQEPDNARSAYYLGETLFRLGQKEEAEEHLRKAVESDGSLYFAAYRLATLCAGRGLYREALVLVRGIAEMQHPGIADDNLQQLAAALENELQRRAPR
jgi:tetratricopeptide (TPR) repeat protein